MTKPLGIHLYYQSLEPSRLQHFIPTRLFVPLGRSSPPELEPQARNSLTAPPLDPLAEPVYRSSQENSDELEKKFKF